MTQTYLTTPEPHAKIHVFYLFEDYNREHKRLTNRVQDELTRLGDVWGDHVSLVMPNPRSADRIEGEIREALGREGWGKLSDALPALMIVSTPLGELSEDAEMHVISFAGKSAVEVAPVIERVRSCVNDLLRHSPNDSPTSLLKRVLNSINLQPGFGGISIDLKELFRRRRPR